MTQTQDALAACTHTGAPSASTWLWWISKGKAGHRTADPSSSVQPEPFVVWGEGDVSCSGRELISDLRHCGASTLGV